jgi:hypothetical protein
VRKLQSQFAHVLQGGQQEAAAQSA